MSITGKINLAAIPGSAVVKHPKSGKNMILIDIEKAELFFSPKTMSVYLDLFMADTPDNEYGNDYMITKSLSKEKRALGEQGVILGNAKKFGGGNSARPVQDQSVVESMEGLPWETPPEEKDDLPF